MSKVLSKNQVKELKIQVIHIIKPYIEYEFSRLLKNPKNIPQIKNTFILNFISRALGYSSFSEINAKYSHADNNDSYYLADLIGDKEIDNQNFKFYFDCNLFDSKKFGGNAIPDDATEIFLGSVSEALEYHCLSSDVRFNNPDGGSAGSYPYCYLLTMHHPDGIELMYDDDMNISLCHTNYDYENIGSITGYYGSIDEVEEDIKNNFEKYLKELKYKIREDWEDL